MDLKNLVNWRLYLILLAMSIFSIVAIMPYILTLQGDLLKSAPMPFPLVILLIVLQSVFLFAIFTFIGLRLSSKLGLQIPILERLVAKEKMDIDVRSIIKISVLLGCLAGIAIIALDFLFSQLGLESLFEQISVPVWQGFLASFYGGICEEIVMRLFFMSLIIWLFSKLIKGKVIENRFVMWSSIIVSALVFGLGHLPVTSALTTVTLFVVLRAIILNGIGGVIFGWLYWKKGLESAMIAHFSADIVIQVGLPFILVIL